MEYKSVINDFHFHFHVVHTYYDYLKEFLSSFSSSLVPCFICYHINPNIPHNLLNCKPLIINIINTPIEVTQKDVRVNFQDRKHTRKNCYNVVLMLINVQNCVLHRFSKILIIYCNQIITIVNNLVVFSSLNDKELYQTSLIKNKFYSKYERGQLITYLYISELHELKKGSQANTNIFDLELPIHQLVPISLILDHQQCE